MGSSNEAALGHQQVNKEGPILPPNGSRSPNRVARNGQVNTSRRGNPQRTRPGRNSLNQSAFGNVSRIQHTGNVPATDFLALPSLNSSAFYSSDTVLETL